MTQRSGIDRPRLPDVTLVAVTSVAIQATIDALQSSMNQCEFGEVLLLTDHDLPSQSPREIVRRQIEPLRSRADYSQFMLRELASHITTSHALCVQWDGYVLRGGAWDPTFLDFDYIGAVWPHFDDDLTVGNGGFSLRSRRLLDECRTLPFDGNEAEDIVIGRTCRAELERKGIRFAPESVARTFAYERGKPTGREFGFHGAFNLVGKLTAGEVVRLFKELDPKMLARSERSELLRWALKRGQIKLALSMIARFV